MRIAFSGPDAEASAALAAGAGARVRHLHDIPDPIDAAGADVLVVDEWTAETAPHVVAARAAGVRVTVLAELLIERFPHRVLAVTGTAGKTTATRLAAAILRAAGIPVVITDTARAANAWPDHDLLAAGVPNGAWLAAELTSTHLCHMDGPVLADVAVLTALWPDHVELHGSPEAYAAAKRRLLDRRRPGGWAVLPADPGTPALLGGPVAGPVASFSVRGPVDRGAWISGGRLMARWDGPATDLGAVADVVPAWVHPAAALAACAAALACGAPAGALPEGLRAAPALPHRLRAIGTLSGTPVVDDAMAATPAKAAASLARFPDGSVVLVAGGEDRPGGAPVHDHPAERALLAGACEEAVRAARAVVLFGPAASRLAPLMAGVDVAFADDLGGALALARGRAAGAEAVLVAPMFPVPQEAREGIARLLDAPTRG